MNRQALTAFVNASKGMTQPCPSCVHGILSLSEATTVETYAPAFHVVGAALPTRERECLVAACSSCEFVTEVKL